MSAAPAAHSDPRQVDVGHLARIGGLLSGRLSAAELPRLRDTVVLPADGVAQVEWSARGLVRQPTGGPAQPWIHLTVKARLGMHCQRCLDTVDLPLALDREFRFARTEEEAAELDAELDEDVLVLSRRFDLIELIEDELLLALPLVPRHTDCRHPHAPTGEVAPDEAPAPHPFAGLQALRKGPGTH
jgi:uncharacterized protein